MTELDTLRNQMAGLAHQISAQGHEIAAMRKVINNTATPIAEARAIAVLMGQDPLLATSVSQDCRPERNKLAVELRRRGWTVRKIAIALSCAERTVERVTGK